MYNNVHTYIHTYRDGWIETHLSHLRCFVGENSKNGEFTKKSIVKKFNVSCVCLFFMIPLFAKGINQSASPEFENVSSNRFRCFLGMYVCMQGNPLCAQGDDGDLDKLFTFVYVELTEGEGVCRMQAEDGWDIYIYIYEREFGSEMGLVL